MEKSAPHAQVNDIFLRMIPVVIIGTPQVANAICKHLAAQKEALTQGKIGVGHINIATDPKEAEMSEDQRVNTVQHLAHESFLRNDRVVAISGFPRSPNEVHYLNHMSRNTCILALRGTPQEALRLTENVIGTMNSKEQAKFLQDEFATVCMLETILRAFEETFRRIQFIPTSHTFDECCQFAVRSVRSHIETVPWAHRLMTQRAAHEYNRPKAANQHKDHEKVVKLMATAIPA